ncbi:MAG: MFS transporter [Alphaproteobacteria bacterium]|nr:MFS transporter [Alphaproteobacteria bacterium]
MSKTRWQGVLFGLGIGWLAAYCHFKLPLALPAMAEAFGYSKLLGGALMSVFALAGLALSAAVGRGLSRGAGRTLVAAALTAIAAGGGLGLASPELGAAMLMARALEGVGYAILAVAGAVIADAHAAPRHRAMVMALYAAWIPAGQLTAVAVALPTEADWQVMWALSPLAALLLAAWSWRLGNVMPEARGAGRHDDAPASPERRLAIRAAALLFTLWSIQYMAYMTWLPSFLVEAHELAIGAVVLGYGVSPAIVLVANQVGGAILGRGVSIARVLLPALAVQAATWLLVPATGADWTGLVSLFAYGASTGFTTVCLFALPARLAGPGLDMARGFGILMAGRNLGVLAGPLALPPLLLMAGDWSAIGPVFGAVTLAALGLAVWLVGAAQRANR